MRTVITKKIDSHNVVTGFDYAITDPESTKTRVDEIMIADGDFDLMTSKATEINIKNSEIMAFKKKRPRPDPMKIFLAKAKFEQLLQEYAVITKTFIEKKNRLLKEEIIYFEPKSGEHIIADQEHTEIRTKLKGLPENRKACINKTDEIMEVYDIVDFRGKAYFEKGGDLKWSKHVIENIATPIPIDGRLLSDLSLDDRIEIRDQQETERIGKMSLVKREAERDSRIEIALTMAGIQKNKYEILGEADPVGKAKEYFETRKTELINKYK